MQINHQKALNYKHQLFGIVINYIVQLIFIMKIGYCVLRSLKMTNEKKFCDMTPNERFDDLHDRVDKFNILELPGQLRMMHMGTSHLVNDLWHELKNNIDHKDQ